MANQLSFHKKKDKFESDVIQFAEDAALELHFTEVPEYKGVSIYVFESLSNEYWQLCYHDTLRMENTFCKTIEGYSREAYYKVVCSEEPESAYYI